MSTVINRLQSDILAIAEVYKNEGNDAYRNRDFNDAINYYTEGIKVNCRDDDMKAKPYNNRAIAHFYSGKKPYSGQSKVQILALNGSPFD